MTWLASTEASGPSVVTHVDERGTTICVSLSYVFSHSLTRFLQACFVSRGAAGGAPRKAHLGTATSTVSRYSELLVPAKSSAETTSASDRMDKFPLQ